MNATVQRFCPYCRTAVAETPARRYVNGIRPVTGLPGCEFCNPMGSGAKKKDDEAGWLLEFECLEHRKGAIGHKTIGGEVTRWRSRHDGTEITITVRTTLANASFHVSSNHRLRDGVGFLDKVPSFLDVQVVKGGAGRRAELRRRIQGADSYGRAALVRYSGEPLRRPS